MAVDPNEEQSFWDFDWGDPEKVAALRADIEAEDGDDPHWLWMKEDPQRGDDDWDCALALFGIIPHPHDG